MRRANRHAVAALVRELDALVARLRSRLTDEDRRLRWDDAKAVAWIQILEDVRAELLSTNPDPLDIWMVGGVARRLDAEGTGEGDIAEALYALAAQAANLRR